MIANVLYTQAQLLDKALDKVKTTGLFITTVVALNDLNDADKTWNNFKVHFTKAYKVHLNSSPTTGAAGYHGPAANIRAINNNISTANSKLR